MPEITQILQSLERGDVQAADELLPLVYEELRKLAAYKMSLQPPGQTLQATALVHEAYLRLVGNEEKRWESRRHFFNAAAEAMQHILIDRARRRLRAKHGENIERVPLDDVDIAAPAKEEILLQRDEPWKFSSLPSRSVRSPILSPPRGNSSRSRRPRRRNRLTSRLDALDWRA
ncbi:MAG: ECF-type sigma factor [Verrucomicrobia subdivision 3 bacterium]|nr:ECF-type sigma factor [Limisphaerales bacterium]